MPELEPKTGRFTPYEINEIESLTTEDGRLVLQTLLKQRMPAFLNQEPEIKVSNFSEALRGLVRVALTDVYHARLDFQYQHVAGVLAEIGSADRIRAMGDSAHRAMDVGPHRSVAQKR